MNKTSIGVLGLILQALHLPHAQAAGSAPLGDEFQVNSTTQSDQQLPAVARAQDGRFVVAWDSVGQDGSSSGIYAQRYAADGSRLGGEFRVNSYTNDLQSFPATAMSAGGNFVVVWDSQGQDGEGLSVRAQRYAADGTPQGAEFRVDDSGERRSVQAQVGVAMDAAGDFAVTWSEAVDKRGPRRIRARLYSADGSARDGSFLVDSSYGEPLRSPQVAMNAAGQFAIAWVGRANAVHARSYEADGRSARHIFRVNSERSFVVDRPAVAIDGNGGLVVAWETFTDNGSLAGVRARRFDAQGSALAEDFAVGNGEFQRYPAVAMSGDGAFLIAAHGSGIHAQRYAADGSAQGEQVLVNQSGGQAQLFAAVAMTPDGSCVLAWQNWQQDGDGRGIYARLYSGP